MLLEEKEGGILRTFEKDEYNYNEIVMQVKKMIKDSTKPQKKIDIEFEKKSIITHIPLKYQELLNEYKKLIKIRKAKRLIPSRRKEEPYEEEPGPEEKETKTRVMSGTTLEKITAEKEDGMKFAVKRGKAETGKQEQIAERISEKEDVIIPERNLEEEVSVSDLLAKIRERKTLRKKTKKKVLSYNEELEKLSWINSLDDNKILTYAQEHLPNTYNMFLQGTIDKHNFRNRVKYRIALDEGVSEVTAAKYFSG